MFSNEPDEINPNVLGREFPVLVTGGSGYMASWLVKYLLEDGYKVRITVRDQEDQDKYRPLEKIAERSAGSLRIFEADLLDPHAYDACMNGCNIIFHTASPYQLSGIKNPQVELVNPSLEGNKNVLEAVNKTPSVKKVILTSALSAIYGDASDLNYIETGTFSEEFWNKSNSLKHQPLGFAKTIAEKEAWKIHDNQKRWKMVALNPSLFVGPSLTSKSNSGSFEFIRKIADGTFKNGAPPIQYGLVDVRDVAHAHIFAAQDEHATGRFMLVHEVKSILGIAQILQSRFGDEFNFPKKEMNQTMLSLFGFFQGYSRKFIIENAGKDLAFDNSKSKNILGIRYKPIDEALHETLKFILEHNMLK